MCVCVCVCVFVCVCLHAFKWALSLSSLSVPPLSRTQVIFHFLFLSIHSNTAHIDSHVNRIPSERFVIKNVHTHVCNEPAKRRKKKTKSAKRRNVNTLRPQPSSKQRRRRRRLIISLGLSHVCDTATLDTSPRQASTVACLQIPLTQMSTSRH